MLKKIGFVTAAAAAGAFLAGGVAAAGTPDGHDHHGDSVHTNQASLLNLNNTDVLHNLNVTPGVCGNDVNVLGVQVPLHDVLNGVNVPILSAGESDDEDGTDAGTGAQGESPYNCASSTVVDGGTSQGE